jgi:hypothetical protein
VVIAWALRNSDHRRAIIAAYVGAVFMPPIGIAFGIYLLVKKSFVHGVSSSVLAFLTMSFWYVYFTTLCGGC